MKEVLGFLNSAGVYFLATMDGDQPRVRPIGFVMEYDGKLMFCTGNNKNMCQQMVQNPKVEIACYDGAGTTLRITGSVVFATTEDSQTKAFEVMPMLSNLYSVGDGIFEIFYLEDATAVCFTMDGKTTALPI